MAVVTAPRINVRGGPGTTNAIVATAANGDQLPIVGVSGDKSWYQVQVTGLADPAWVFAGLTTLNGTLDGVPQVAVLPRRRCSSGRCSACARALCACCSPNTSTGFGYGVTANMWQGDKQGTANLVNQMGFNWVKQQVRWEYAEPSPGAIQWQEMDDIVNTMNVNGIKVMFSVVTSPPWTRPNKGGTGGPPEDFQLFANFLGAICRALLWPAAGD